jgi:hypothetical protein
MGEKRNVYRLLVGKPEGKKPLGRSRRRWWDNVKMNLGEIEWDGVNWIGPLRIGTVESSCESGNEPSGSIKCWETIQWLNNWCTLV